MQLLLLTLLLLLLHLLHSKFSQLHKKPAFGPAFLFSIAYSAEQCTPEQNSTDPSSPVKLSTTLSKPELDRLRTQTDTNHISH
jgi:hypothetical protein